MQLVHCNVHSAYCTPVVSAGSTSMAGNPDRSQYQCHTNNRITKLIACRLQDAACVCVPCTITEQTHITYTPQTQHVHGRRHDGCAAAVGRCRRTGRSTTRRRRRAVGRGTPAAPARRRASARPVAAAGDAVPAVPAAPVRRLLAAGADAPGGRPGDPRQLRAAAHRRLPRQLPQVRHHLAQGPRLRGAAPGGARAVRRNPHDCVKFLELELTLAEDDMAGVMAELEELPSPRVFASHLPHSMLPMSITEHCRIVYISRNPKDALVSSWLFTKKSAAAVGVDDTQSFTLQEAFELFCEGRSLFGPQWLHARQYWEASVRRLDKVLFLRYEEMLLDPKCNLKKLAKFMGCEFSEEEEGGVVDEIVELCSLEKLKNVEVNKNGRSKFDIKNENFFRKGVAGDWANHMTPEMAQRLDKFVDDALQGSGLTFSNQG